MAISMLIPKVTLRQDGILHFIYPPGMNVTAHMMEDVLSRHKVMAPNKKSPILVDMERGDPFDRDIRAFVRRKDVVDHTLSMALVSKSRIGTMLANIYFQVTPLPYPSRLFTNRDAAVKWLLSMQDGSESLPGLSATMVHSAEYHDFGSQANHLARLCFALDDGLEALEQGEGRKLSEVQHMQMRLLAHDLDMELQGVRDGSRLFAFLAETGFDPVEVRGKLDRFRDLSC